MQLSPDQIPQFVESIDNKRGFLLTRSASDRNNHIEITLWLKTPQGPVQLIIDNERAVFFVEVSDINHARDILANQGINVDEIKPLALKTFKQVKVAAVYFLTLKAFYQAREALKQKGVKCYEDDIRPDDRFLMERFITADITFAGQESPLKLSQNHTHTQYHSQNQTSNQRYRRYERVKCKPIDKAQQSDITLSTVSLDIECSMSGELYSIGLYSEYCQQVMMIANEQEIANEKIKHCDVDILWLADEQQLLLNLLAWFTQHDPDIIIGWNVINFDFNLLQKRYDLHNIKFAIGRDGKTPYWRTNKASEQQFIEINGRVILDGIDLLKTATYNFPSFSLDNVANTLLGIGK